MPPGSHKFIKWTNYRDTVHVEIEHEQECHSCPRTAVRCAARRGTAARGKIYARIHNYIYQSPGHSQSLFLHFKSDHKYSNQAINLNFKQKHTLTNQIASNTRLFSINPVSLLIWAMRCLSLPSCRWGICSRVGGLCMFSLCHSGFLPQSSNCHFQTAYNFACVFSDCVHALWMTSILSRVFPFHTPQAFWARHYSNPMTPYWMCGWNWLGGLLALC